MKTIAGLVTALLLCGTAHAQSGKPMRFVVPYVQGNAIDVVSRMIAEKMGALLEQTMIVANVGGGSGIPAVVELINAPADGNTVLGVDAGHWAITPAMRSDLPYRPERDFAPISVIFTSPLFVIVRSDLPGSTLREFVAEVRAKPGKLSYGSVGIGSVFHLSVESLKSSVGNLGIVHIPYKGGSESIQALMRGDIAMAVGSLAVSRAGLESGKLKLIAVMSRTRNKQAPDIPTVAEALALPDFHFAGVYGMVARSGTPKPTLERLTQALQKALDAEVVARMAKFGIEITPSTPEEMGQLIRAEMKKFGDAVKASGVQAN